MTSLESKNTFTNFKLYSVPKSNQKGLGIHTQSVELSRENIHRLKHKIRRPKNVSI